MPEKYKITENTGTFEQVIEACKKNERFFPGFWIKEEDGLIFFDYDGTSDNIHTIPQFPSYCERSVYGYGYHILGWYKGDKPDIPIDDPNYAHECYTWGRWVVITGDVVDGRVDINDLTDTLQKYITPPDNGNKSNPFKVPVTAESRHPVLKSMVGSMVSKGYSFKSILAACQEENIATFKPPKTREQIEKEVTNMYDWAMKKQVIKEREKKENSSEKKETAPDDETQRPYFIEDNTLYLTCMDARNHYFFVHYDGEKLVFTPSHKGIFPRKLQEKDGLPIRYVGIPSKEQLEQSDLSITATDLYELIDTHLDRYIDAPALERELFIYYLIFSWYYVKTTTAPYLRFIADTGNGKSRFERCCGDLCFYPIRCAGASSVSGIMRMKEKWNGTLLIDEADLKESTTTNELVKYLNLGFERGQYYLKTDKEDTKQQDIFDPFCPKVIAMRHPFQDNATEGRLLSYSPKETRRKGIPILLTSVYDTAVEELRATIAAFVMRTWSCVDGNATIDLTEVNIEARLKQLGMPLSIVLQLFPDGTERLKEYLLKRQTEIKNIRAASLEGMTFNSVLDLIDSMPKDNPYLSAREVHEKCGLRNPAQATKILHGIGFKTEVTHVAGKNVRKLVVPDNFTWTNIIQRYYVSDDKKYAECPHILKGLKFVSQQLKLDTATDATRATLVGETPPQVKLKNEVNMQGGVCSTGVAPVAGVAKEGSEPV